MAQRGRPRKNENPIRNTDCTYCEGYGFHWGKECGGCDGTGKRRVQNALDRVYKIKNGIPLRTKT